MRLDPAEENNSKNIPSTQQRIANCMIQKRASTLAPHEEKDYAND